MPQPNRGPVLRRFLPLLGLALLASCSGPFSGAVGAAKVDVDTLSTDILFGVPSPSPVTAQNGQAATAVLPPMTLTLPEQPPSLSFEGTNVTFPSIPAPAACPTAPATSFPAQVAGSDVTTMPGSGSYRWASAGSWEKMILTTPVKIPIPTFEQRIVRRATKVADPVPALPGSSPDFSFTYQTIEPRVSDTSALLMTWKVKANAATGDPEGGLTLQQVDVIDKDGKPAGTMFHAVTGLLLLPLPAQPGTKIRSSSVDSTGSNNLQLTGTVGNRERVDACGDPVQAWGVDATLTNAGAGSAAPATLHYDVATQFGALVVAFNIDGTFFGTKFDKETARIGQLKGDPVPDAYK
jgi:hypothetical protein